MTTSIGDYKKSSGSDSEGTMGKKQDEEGKLLTSESEDERNSRSKKPARKAESIEPSNSKKPKKRGAYKAFLRKKIPRRNNPKPVDVQSLQRVIDAMPSSRGGLYYEQTEEAEKASSWNK